MVSRPIHTVLITAPSIPLTAVTSTSPHSRPNKQFQESVDGLAVTEIPSGSVAKIKKQMTEAMNRIAGEMDEETRQRLLEESKMVFILNNSMVHSIEGAGAVIGLKIIKLGVYVALAAVFYTGIKKLVSGYL